jgi:hypothetical protein
MSSFDNLYILSPIAGDNASQIQTAVNYARDNAGWKVLLMPGTYSISSPIFIMNGTNGQISMEIMGVESAKNTTDPRQSIISPTYNDKPAFIVQKGKGVTIRNLAFRGQYTRPNSLTVYQLQTMKYADWATGDPCRHNQYSPYCAICIDPFSDPVYGIAEQYPGLSAYYVAGIGRGGSTGVDIIGCKITNFVVGIIYQPTEQQNGDICGIIECAIELNKIGVSYCQDQTKGNTIYRLRCWGATHTLIDCNYYGKGIGTMPFIDTMNIAGGITQIFNCSSGNRFTASARNIYAELVFKIGEIGGAPTPSIYDSTFEFIDFGYAPDYFIYPYRNLNFIGCQFRIYNGQVNKLIFSGFNGSFIGGSMETPIVVSIQNGGTGLNVPELINVTNMDFNLAGGIPVKYQSSSGLNIKTYLGSLTLAISGYEATMDLGSAISVVNVGDYLAAGEENTHLYDDPGYAPTVQLGRVISKAGTVATLDQVSIIAKNQSYSVYKV